MESRKTLFTTLIPFFAGYLLVTKWDTSHPAPMAISLGIACLAFSRYLGMIFLPAMYIANRRHAFVHMSEEDKFLLHRSQWAVPIMGICTGVALHGFNLITLRGGYIVAAWLTLIYYRKLEERFRLP